MNPNQARLIVTGGFLVIYGYSYVRSLYRQNKKLKAMVLKQAAWINYIAYLAEREGLELEEFDAIAIDALTQDIIEESA
jgi:hypothetical protein